MSCKPGTGRPPGRTETRWEAVSDRPGRGEHVKRERRDGQRLVLQETSPPRGLVEAIMRPDGFPVWGSDTAPGHRHDISLACDSGALAAL